MHPSNRMNAPAPGIDPIWEPAPRPLWSVMIPVYNCAGYLRETLLSVLCQDPGADRMQIEVVDNCSTADDPESVVRAIGGRRGGIHPQAGNVGRSQRCHTCHRTCSGGRVPG